MAEKAPTKKRLVSTATFRIMAVAVVAIVLVGGVSLYRDYSALQDNLRQELAAYETEKRQMLVDRTRQAVSYVDYTRSRLDEQLREELVRQVDQAHAIVAHLASRYGSAADRGRLAEMVRETLRPLRWREGRAYFFAIDLHGVNQLHPPDPSLEGDSVLTAEDDRQRRAAVAVLNAVRSTDRKEGFIDWEWPNPSAEGKIQRKLGFVRLFEPLGWIIGTGEYLADFEDDLKKRVLNRLDAIGFDDGGYIFVSGWDGIALGKRPNVRGRNMWDVEDANGTKIVQELVAKAKGGSGFLEYVMPDFGGTEPFRKISHVVGIPEWEWYVGTGTSLREIELALAEKHKTGLAEISQRAFLHAIFLLAVLGAFVLFSRRMAVRVESDYKRFAAFFKGAATSDALIAIDRLAFVEFEELAHAANRMIEERRDVGRRLSERDELYRSAFETSPDSINLNRLDDGLYVDVNRGFTELTGYGWEDVAGKSSADLGIWVDPADRDRLVAGLRTDGRVVNLEAGFRRKDGSVTTALMSARLLNIKGAPHILSVTRDISNIKQAEEALRQSEEKYRLLVENQTDLIAKIDPQGHILYVSPSCCELFGMSEDELLGQHFAGLVHEDDRKIAETQIRELMKPPHVGYAEVRYRTKQGVRWLAWQDAAILDDDGTVREFIGIGRDIHDRKLVAEALAESERKFRRAIEKMPLIGISLDAEGRLEFANDHFLKLTGWTVEDVIGHDWFEMFVPADQSERIVRIFNSAMETGELGEDVNHANEILTKDGNRILVAWFNVLARDPDGKVIGLTGMGLDVTERTRAEKTLEEERRFTHTVLETLSDGVVACNADGEMTLSNRALREFHGFDCASEQGAFEDSAARQNLLYPDGRKVMSEDELPLFRALRGESVRDFEMVIVSRGGRSRIMSVNAEPMRGPDGESAGAVAISRDITEQKRIEEQLRHAQKMEAVGHLTGGIAHDFNNLLQVILTNLQIAESLVSDDRNLAKWLRGAQHAGWRGAELTQKLLSFSRKQTLYPTNVDSNTLIWGMHDLLRRTLGEDIEIVTILDEPAAPILIDPGGLENAILNLAINARSAMPDGGKLTIESRVKILRSDIAVEDGYLSPGAYVEIAITDTGCGMPPEVLERAFEPFFTTKDVGEGSGLGLSIIYGFARQSGGNVTIESAAGAGTTVALLLPAATASGSEQEKEASSETRHVGKGTVLVVEDDPDVRASTVAMFEMLGYRALEVEDGVAALEALDGTVPIDLLFTDVVMPKGIGGFDLARLAIGKNGNLKVILASGYPEAELSRSGLSETEFPLLKKPYTYEELGTALSETFGE